MFIVFKSIIYRQPTIFKGTKCKEPPRTKSKDQNAPSYFSDEIDPKNGNVTLLQTGKTVSYICPGSDSHFSPIPMTDLTNSACKGNEIRIKRTSQSTAYEEDDNITTSSYQISAKNDIRGGKTKADGEDDSMTLMILLTFSQDVSAEQIQITSTVNPEIDPADNVSWL